MSVVSGAVGANLLDGTASMNAAVKVNHIVVAYALEAFLAVPSVQILDGVVAAGGCGAAVDYYFCYFSHNCKWV